MKKLVFGLCLILISPHDGFADAPYGGTAYFELSFAAAGIYSFLDYAGTHDDVLSVGALFFGRFIFSGGWGLGVLYGGGLTLHDSLGISGPISLIMDAGIGPCFPFRFGSDTASFTIMPAAHFCLVNGYPMFGVIFASEIVILVSRLGGIHFGLSTSFDFVPASNYVPLAGSYTFGFNARLYFGVTMFISLTGTAPPAEEIGFRPLGEKP
ncbi:MAG: hypothetical protein JXD23_05640 [Spirochaetales bacterium]|nr:hypothetical protein [Spirochaetales bacterium]